MCHNPDEKKTIRDTDCIQKVGSILTCRRKNIHEKYEEKIRTEKFTIE